MNGKPLITMLGALVSAGLVGCVGPTASRTAVYQMDTEPLSIQATCNSGAFSTDIVVQVNGQAVATGSTTQVKPQVNMSGKYKDMTIDADCKSIKTGSMLHRECVVYVNGQKAAELSCR